MQDKKEVLAVRIPNGSCPICGHKQFVVSDISHNLYLTNRDGEIVDYNEYRRNIRGFCVNCHNVIKMRPTSYGYVPTNALSEFMEEYDKEKDIKERINYDNPMLLGGCKDEN